MPNQGAKGVIKPLAPESIGLIKWRLRYLDEPRSRVVMQKIETCANCHSFSADGKTLGLDVDGPANDHGLYALIPVSAKTAIRTQDVIKWPTVRDAKVPRLRAAFMSQISPDGRYVVSTIDDPDAVKRAAGRTLEDKYYVANFLAYRFLQVFYPTRGILGWYDRETKDLQPLPGANDPRYVQTSGVWSRDGKYVVFARAEAKTPYPPGVPLAQYANDPNETQIQYDLYRIPFNGGKGGTPERIVGASAERNEQQLSEGIAGWPLDCVCAGPERHGHAPGRQALHRAFRGRRSPADEVQHAADELLAHIFAERPLAGLLIEEPFAVHAVIPDAY